MFGTTPGARRRARRTWPAAAVAVVGLLAGACGGDGDGGNPFGKDVDPPGSVGTSGPGSSGGASDENGTAAPQNSGSAGAGKGTTDPRVVDPCSFVTREALAEFAATPSTPPTPPGGAPPRTAEEPVAMTPGVSFTRCEIEILVKGGGLVDVVIDYAGSAVEEARLADLGDGATVTDVGDGLRVLSAPHGGDVTKPCQRGLVDKESRLTTVEAKGRNAMAQGTDVCAIADTVVETGVRRVVDGALTKRTYAKNSFTALKACETVSDATLAKVMGVPAQKIPEPAEFGCSVGMPETAVVLVRLALKSNPPNWTGNARQAQVAGRASMVEYEEAAPAYRLPGRCTVTTLGVPLPQSEYVEIAEIVFMQPSQGEQQLCAAAQELAGEMFARLPK